jgi:transcriptional regulator with XRE-family HTH domain
MGEDVVDGAFGRLLRYWRQVRKRSQENVALEIDSSIKHSSSLEKGKSLPRQRSLDMPARSGVVVAISRAQPTLAIIMARPSNAEAGQRIRSVVIDSSPDMCGA